MKKQLHPAVVAAIVIVVLGVAGFFFYKGTATPEPVMMGAQGPAASMMKGAQGSGRMTPDVLEAQKQAQQQSGQGGTPGK